MAYDWSRYGSGVGLVEGGVKQAGGFMGKFGGVIGGGLQVGAAVGDAYNAFVSAKTAKRDAQFQAQVAQFASEQDDQRAVERARAGSEEIFKLRLKQSQLEGTQRARLFAGGGGGESGRRILADTKYISDLDAGTLKTNTDRAVFLLRQGARAKSFDMKSLLAMAKGISPSLATATSAIGSARTVADRWYATRTTGTRG